MLAGTGDNGGDALYAGALLASRGAGVNAIQAGRKIHPGGAAALRTRGGRVVTVTPPRGPDDTLPDAGTRYDAGHDARQAIGRADLIIDGMLGIGGSGGLREPYATLAHLAAGERDERHLLVEEDCAVDERERGHQVRHEHRLRRAGTRDEAEVEEVGGARRGHAEVEH